MFFIRILASISNMKKVIQQVLEKLGLDRKVFYSEDDFKHSVAFGIHDKFDKKNADLDIRLEVPKNVEFQFRNGSTLEKEIYLDILLTCKECMWPIELKYKTKKSKLSVDREVYNLKNHSARDVSRYNFRKDIYRIEKLKKHPIFKNGYAIILTNDSKYWEDDTDEINMDGNYRISDKIFKNDSGWLYIDSEYFRNLYYFDKNDGLYRSKKTDKKHWTYSKENNYDLQLSVEYKAEWKDFSLISDSLFRYLLVEI